MPTKPKPTTAAKASILSRLYADLADAINRRDDDVDGFVVGATGRITGSGIVFEEHLPLGESNQWLQDFYNADGLVMGSDLDALLTNAVTRIEKGIEAAKKIT